jgi:hypothetical protein
MIQTLRGTYSNFRPEENPDQTRAYSEAIGRMVEEFGQGRVAAGIQKACDIVPDFVPTPGRIREFIPLPGPIKTCSLCHPSGYIMVYEGRTSREPNSQGIAADGGNPIDPKFGAARRCDHKGGFSPIADIHGPDERQYGNVDAWALWAIHKEAAKKANGRPLTEEELDECVNELDRRIDEVDRRTGK